MCAAPICRRSTRGARSAFPGFLTAGLHYQMPNAGNDGLLNDLQAPVPHETVNRTIRLSNSTSIFAPESRRLRVQAASCGEFSGQDERQAA